MWFFGVVARWNRERSVITIGDKTIRLVKPERYSDRLRGTHVDDVFGDVAGETIDRHEEFFYILANRQGRSWDDGTGLRLMIVR
jgi:hypothetical protein